MVDVSAISVQSYFGDYEPISDNAEGKKERITHYWCHFTILSIILLIIKICIANNR